MKLVSHLTHLQGCREGMGEWGEGAVLLYICFVSSCGWRIRHVYIPKYPRQQLLIRTPLVCEPPQGLICLDRAGLALSGAQKAASGFEKPQSLRLRCG